MTLIVPAGGTFSIGSSGGGGQSGMNMSLDDVIASRRKETVAASRRGGRTRVSTADRTVASGRAKRAAAVNARRNLTTTKKPTKMEIEKEVKTQNARTQKAKANQEKKKAGGRVAATGGRTRRAAAREAGHRRATAAKNVKQTKTKQAAVQIGQGRPPSKKAVNAAVQAFKANGFQIPQGTQMVIRFESASDTTPAPGSQTARNTARAAGRQKAAAKNNNNNTRSNNRNNINSNNRRASGGRGRGGRGRN